MDRSDSNNVSYHERMQLLDERFRRLQEIAELSNSDHDEAGALAFALVELDAAAQDILRCVEKLQLPGEIGNPEILDNLFELGDNIRHLLSHARQPRFFSVYLDEIG